MEQRDVDETRVHGRLPNMHIDIVHRRVPDSDAELVSVTVTAVLHPQAFDVFLPFADPFRLWTQLAEAAWSPWLQGLRALSSPPVRRLSKTADD
jgi:hypothetical protein